MLYETFAAIADLRSSPKELWLLYLLTILDGFAHSSLSFSLVLFLSQHLGMSDLEAGWCYGAFALATSLSGLTLGFMVDVLGMRSVLVAVMVAQVIGRITLAVTQ
jgi:MFS family permease